MQDDKPAIYLDQIWEHTDTGRRYTVTGYYRCWGPNDPKGTDISDVEITSNDDYETECCMTETEFRANYQLKEDFGNIFERF